MEPERHVLALGIGALCALSLVLACQPDRRSNGGAGGAPVAGAGGAAAMGGGALGGGGTAGTEDGHEIAGALDGFVFAQPCGERVNARLCETSPERPCPRDRDPALSGFRATDETVVLGGDPKLVYDVELFVQGLVEARNYVGGADQASSSELPADGFYAGGRPEAGSAQNIVMIRVADPPADYFLNALATAEDSRLRRSVFPIGYKAHVRARGGTSVRLVLTDPNCHAVRNCADPDADDCAPHRLDFLDPRFSLASGAALEDFDGQLVGLLVTGVRRE
jgi:hypothetical protein